MRVQGSLVAIVFSLFLAGEALFLSAAAVSGQTVLPPKELKEVARQILLREQDSVVWVTAKVRLRKQSDGSAVPGEEATLEVLGTVVEESGLTVVSDADFSPEKVLAAKTASGDAVPEFSFVEIVINGEVTVPATVIYRDKDLDLAFLQPDEKIAKQRGAKFRPVDTSSGHSLEVMDDVVHVARLDASMDRAASVGIGNVASVVRGSRTFYQTTTEIVPGAPIYGADGALLGIGVHRIVDGVPSALVALSSETVQLIAEIAEATGFLTAKSEEIGVSLTEGLTLSLPEKKAAPEPVAAPAPEPAPLPTTVDVSTPPLMPVTPIPAPEPTTPASSSGGPTIRTVQQPTAKPTPATVKVVGAQVMPQEQTQAQAEPPPLPEPVPVVPGPEPEPVVAAPAPASIPEPEKPVSKRASAPKPAPPPEPILSTTTLGSLATRLKPNAVAAAAAAAASSQPAGESRGTIPPPDSGSGKGGLKGFLGKIKFQSRRQPGREETVEKPVVEPVPPVEGEEKP